MTKTIETDYDTGWREGYEAASGAARLQIEQLQVALKDLGDWSRREITMLRDQLHDKT